MMIVPNNEDTRTIMYDQRFLLGDKRRTPPLTYQVSKVSPSMSGDIVQFTMTQEQYSASLDNAEEMVGGYYVSAVIPELPELEEVPTVSDLEIICSGNPTVRAGGGFKKFTLKSNADDKLENVEWSVDFYGNEDKLECLAQNNVFKIKCINDYSLIGKTFTVTAESKHSSKSIIVEVTSL